jgi:hypothetical protein
MRKRRQMPQPNADDAHSKPRLAGKLARIRKNLRRSAQRNRGAVEGLACVLGLLIGIVFGAIVAREAPAGLSVGDGRAATTLPP